jgi:transposase
LWLLPGGQGVGSARWPPLLGRGRRGTRVRLSTGHGRKTDAADATSVGIAALTATGLHTVEINEAVIALRALVEHRDDLIKTRTQTTNRLHALLPQLILAGAPTHLSADTAAQLLRTHTPADPDAAHPASAGQRADH